MALQATEPLKSGAVLTGAELRLTGTWVETGAREAVWNPAQLVGKQEAVWNPAQLVGKQLTESVRMGETLSAHQVAAPRAVQRGQSVTLWCKIGAVVVKGVAVAQADGRVGDVIEFVREGSRQEVFATVSGPREATISQALGTPGGPGIREVAQGGTR
ncbi:MAG: flagellar basal body P-ring formation chaperone FlgA [Planctomycetota bacterium]|jgi:hypothetical protein